MASSIEREIRFIIKMRKETKAIGEFVAEIEGVKKAVQSLKGVSSESGIDKIQKSMKALREFMKGLGSTAKGVNFKNFERVGIAFSNIASGVKMANTSMAEFARIFKSIELLGGMFKGKRDDVAFALIVFEKIAEQLKEIASISNTKLSNLNNMFSSLSKISGMGLVSELNKVKESVEPAKQLNIALAGIVASLKDPGVVVGANAIARALMGGGGGGAPALGGIAFGATGLRVKQDVSNVLGGQAMGSDYERLLGSFKVGKAVPASTLAYGTGGQSGIPDEIRSMMVASGTMFHKATEDIVKQLGLTKEGAMGKSFIDFLVKKQHNDERFAHSVSSVASQTATEFRSLMGQAISEADIPETEKNRLRKFVTSQSNRLYAAVRKFGAGKSSFFNHLNAMLVKKFGTDVNAQIQGLQGATMAIESKMGQQQLIAPGIKRPEGVDKAVYSAARSEISSVLRELRKDPEGGKLKARELAKRVRDFGLNVSGVVDMMMTFEGGLEKWIFDLKAGSIDLNAFGLQLQTKIYRMMEAVKSGTPLKGIKSFLYSGKTGTMRESVAGTAGLASVPGLTEEVKQVESLEEVNRLKKEIALRNKVIQDLNLKIVESQRKERDGVRETTTALKEKEAVVSSIAAKTTPPGGVGGQPPPGGGSVPPIIPIPVVTPLLSREMMLDKSRTFAEISVAMSRYNEVLTGAYLKQTMMGERIDLTAVKMSEYQHVVDKTSSVLAKHVSYQDVQDKKYMENIAVIERLVDVIGKEGKAYDEIKTKQERLQKTREEITFRLGAGELGKELADKAKGSLASLKGTSAQEGLFFKEVSRLTTDVPKGKEIKGLADSGIKLQGTINRLSQGFVDFNTKMTTAMSTGKGTDKVLKEIMATMKANDPIFAAEAAGVKNLEQASQALANAVAREQRAFISNVGTVEQAEARAKEFANGLMVLDEKTQKLTKSTEGFNLGAAKLNLRIRTLKASERELVGDVERVANAYALQTNHLLKLQRESAKTGLGQSAREKLNRKEIEMTTAKVKELAQIYEVLEKGRKGYSDEIAKLGETQRRLDSKTSEHYRGMIRTTLRGFADMMKSQTAWIAGYAVMFGSIRALKSALGSVIEMEHQFARAMRTSRSELMETAEILDRYKSEGVLAMMRFGKTSADVGEILYQMGSAGLKSEEALASLNSTMNMLVATEGEVADTTKMIASIYNNFGDQITSATGLVGKFKYINDIATATFRDHQVEINEYREGLKYLTAMGKVSNLTFLEMSGILGTLNDHMIKSGIAGRSMQSILSRLTKDAYGFAKAFDIPIRLGAPVDLLGILDQISGKMNAGALTAGEVGKVFERLGLRGSQSFVTLLKYMDELRGNIKKLEETSVNASEEMARVMLEKPDVAFARMRETIFALIRLGFEPLVKIAYGAAFGISMVGVKIGEIQGPLSTFLGTIVRLTGMFATLAATSAIFGVIRTKLRPGTADWKTLSEFLEAIKKRFADIGKYAREFYIALRSGQMASASKAFDLLGIKIIGAAWAFKLLLAAIVAYGIYKLVDKLHTSNAEYVAMANNISKVVVQSKEEIDALQKKIKSYENLNRELDRYEEYQQNEAARKLVEKYEADLKSLESITKTIDDMRKKLVKPLVSDKEAYEMIAKLQSQSGVVIAPSEKSVAAMRKAIIKEAIDMIKEMETGWTNSRKAAEATLKEIPKGSRYVGQFTEAINKLREAFNSLTEFKEIGEDLTTEIKNLIDKALELKNALVTPPYEAKIGSWDKLISKEWGISEQGNLTRNLEEQLKLEKEIAHVKMEEGKEVIRGSAYISGIRKETVKEMKKEFLNRVAETLLDVKITGETVELSKEALAIGESLLKLVVKEFDIRKQIAKQVKTLSDEYEKQLLTLGKGFITQLGQMVKSGPLQTLLTIDSETENRIIRIRDTISNMVEKVKLLSKEQRKAFFDERGITSIAEYERPLRELADLTERTSLFGADLAKQRAREQILTDDIALMHKYSRQLRDITYETEQYHSVEEEMANLRDINRRKLEDLNVTLRKSAFTHRELDQTINHLIDENGEFNGVTKEQISIFIEKWEQEEKELDQIKALIDATIKLNKVNIERTQLEKELNKIKSISEFVDTAGEAFLANRQYDTALLYAQKSLDLKEDIAKKEFEINRKQLEKFGVSEKQLDDALLAIHMNYEQQKMFITLEFQRKRIQIEQSYYAQSAELAMRNISNVGDFWDASVKSIKSGAYDFYAENENISTHLAGMTKNAFDSATSSITDMFGVLVSDAENKSEQYKQIMSNMLTSVGKELMTYGLKLMVIAMIQKMLGWSVATPTGASDAADILAAAPFQHGGQVTGGISGKDSVPIWATPKEYIMPTDTVDYYGVRLMERLRKREIPRMQEGGLVGDRVISTNGGSYGNRVVPMNGGSYKEGDNINYVTIKTNDVNSFKQALYENKTLIAGLVMEEMRETRQGR